MRRTVKGFQSQLAESIRQKKDADVSVPVCECEDAFTWSAAQGLSTL